MAAETSRFQYRTQQVPPRISGLLREKKITATDLLLMFAIDTLVKPQTNEDGIGCYASNAYLGCAANVHEKYVQERLTYLKSMGILLSVKMKGQRYLELEWSRTAEERSAMEGLYGEIIRQAHQNAVESLKTTLIDSGLENGESNNFVTRRSKEKLTRASKEKLTPGGSKEKLTHNNKDELLYKKNEATETKPSRTPSACGGGVFSSNSNGHSLTNGESTNVSAPSGGIAPAYSQPTPKKEITRAASYSRALVPSSEQIISNKIYSIATKHNKLPRNAKPKLWPKQIRTKVLAYWSLDEVMSALQWYEDHAHEPYMPEINCACSLANKLHSLLLRIRKQGSVASTVAHTSKPPIKISRTAKKIVEELDNLKWPKGSSRQLPEVIQISLDNLHTAYAKHKKVMELDMDEDPVCLLAQFIDDEIGDDLFFLVGYFTTFFHKVKNWAEWSGTIKPFSVQSKQFQQWGAGRADDEGAEVFWDDYLERIS